MWYKLKTVRLLEVGNFQGFFIYSQTVLCDFVLTSISQAECIDTLSLLSLHYRRLRCVSNLIVFMYLESIPSLLMFT